MTALPAGDATALDLVPAADDAIVRGDLHRARRLLAVLAELVTTANRDAAASE